MGTIQLLWTDGGAGDNFTRKEDNLSSTWLVYTRVRARINSVDNVDFRVRV